MLCTLFVSCSENNVIEYVDNVASKENVQLNTEVSSSEVSLIITRADEMMEMDIRTREVGGTPAVSEEDAEKELQPLIVEGKRLRDIILNDISNNMSEYPSGSSSLLLEMSDG